MKLNEKQIAILTAANTKTGPSPLRGVYTVKGKEFMFSQTSSRALVKKGLLEAVDFTIDGLAYTFKITDKGRNCCV